MFFHTTLLPKVILFISLFLASQNLPLSRQLTHVSSPYQLYRWYWKGVHFWTNCWLMNCTKRVQRGSYPINFMTFPEGISILAKAVVCLCTLCLEPHTLHLIEVLHCWHTFLKIKMPPPQKNYLCWINFMLFFLLFCKSEKIKKIFSKFSFCQNDLKWLGFWERGKKSTNPSNIWGNNFLPSHHKRNHSNNKEITAKKEENQ